MAARVSDSSQRDIEHGKPERKTPLQEAPYRMQQPLEIFFPIRMQQTFRE
jgi:hypothetical protein